MKLLTQPQFEREMRRWAVRNVPLIGKLVHAAVATAVYEGIVHKTPVLTGRARGNWFPTLGSPSEEVGEHTAGVSITRQPLTAEEKGRSKTMEDQLKGLPLGAQTAYVTNNLPYIQPLEDGTISQKAAPGAMVQGTIINTLDGLKVDVVLKGVR